MKLQKYNEPVRTKGQKLIHKKLKPVKRSRIWKWKNEKKIKLTEGPISPYRNYSSLVYDV